MFGLRYKKSLILVGVLLTVVGGLFYYWNEARGDYNPNWGVIAFNVDKSIYKVGEEAYMQMAVLDEKGNTLCNADLTLEVTSPSGKVTSPIISYSEECGPETVTDTPDYFAYMHADELGIYKVKTTATTKNGEYFTQDKFEVRAEVPFDIRRTGPTRIYPLSNYSMNAIITVNEDFEGTITEQIPASFTIINVEIKQLDTDSEEPIITESKIISPLDYARAGQKLISSDVSWKAGERYELSYIFDAPDTSPAFFLLGPLRFKVGSDPTFAEIRAWQIASDAAVTNKGLLTYGTQSLTGDIYANTYTNPDTISSQYIKATTAGTIYFIKSVSSPTREEKFVAIGTSGGAGDTLQILTCTTDCDIGGDWTLRGTLAVLSTTPNRRAFDIAYEQLSGRAMIVFRSAGVSNKAYYCIWDGSSWSPSTDSVCAATFAPGTANEINFADTGLPMWVRLVAYGDRLTDKRSNEMLLAVSGDSGFAAARWSKSCCTYAIG